ncbi:MAG: CAP domain-containing protein [Gemmataceae bacterium]
MLPLLAAWLALPGAVVELATLAETNRPRAEAGIARLVSDPALTRLAREHAATMARLNQLGHDLDGRTFAERIAASKLRLTKAAENVAQGPQSPRQAVESWLMSPGHRANLLDPDLTHVGVATAAAADGTRYWIQVFAALAK